MKCWTLTTTKMTGTSLSSDYSAFVFLSHLVANCCCSIRYHLQTFRKPRDMKQDRLRRVQYSFQRVVYTACGLFSRYSLLINILWVILVGSQEEMATNCHRFTIVTDERRSKRLATGRVESRRLISTPPHDPASLDLASRYST